MNALIFAAERVIDNKITLDPRLYKTDARIFSHIKNILKVQRCSKIRVGIISSQIYSATVSAVDEHSAELTLSLHESSPPPPERALRVILALPRPKNLRRIVRSIANLGVKEIDLIQTAKVEKAYWSSHLVRLEVLNDAACEGLEVAQDTKLPKIRFHNRFRPWAEDTFVQYPGSKFLLHPKPNAERLIGESRAIPASVIIGPEGGFTEFEVELLEKLGAKSYSLGSRILSVENAVVTAIQTMSEKQS